jgi:hypothetical protein
LLCFCFVFLRFVYHMLQVSLDCPFLSAPSVFSNFLLIPLLHICITAHSPGFVVTPINISGLKLMIQPNLPCWCRWRIHNTNMILWGNSIGLHNTQDILNVWEQH